VASPCGVAARNRAGEAGVAAPGTDVFVLCNGGFVSCGRRGSVVCAVFCPFFLKNGVVLYGFLARFSS
jgi:hypothetical protein